MAKKTYKVGFYVGSVGADGKGGLISQKLLELSETTRPPEIAESDVEYQIRDLKVFNAGASFSGVFAKIRKKDIPHIGSTAGNERPIDLDDDEGVMEKNYFLFYKKHELLVYQSNGNGSSIEAFGRYFSALFDKTSRFNYVLKKDALGRMMNGNLKPKLIELSIARPKNPELYPADNWSKELFDVMESVGGFNANIKISGEKMGRHKKPLSTKVKNSMAALVENGVANVARITLDEVEQPIDLIADRITTSVTVLMDGRYPNPQSMLHELSNAKDSCKAELEGCLGANNAMD